MLSSLLSACTGNQINEAWYLMAFFMQNGYLCARECTVQSTCFKCPNYISVLHEIFICSDVVSQVLLALAFLDRSVHRHVAPAPAQFAGAGGRGEALPGEPHGSAMLRKPAAPGPPSFYSPSHFTWLGASRLWACPHLPQ